MRYSILLLFVGMGASSKSEAKAHDKTLPQEQKLAHL